MDSYSVYFLDYNRILIGGDFNVPILDFGYTRQTDRTETFLEHLSTKHLYILNDPDAPSSFVQRSLSGHPDLTLGGNEIRDHLENGYVDTDNFSFSDHRYVRFSLTYQILLKNNDRYKTKTKIS